jgi:Flp pilus assembly protein TadB
MTEGRPFLLVIALVGAATCGLLLVRPRIDALTTAKRRVHQTLSLDRVRITLVQAELDWLPVPAWIALRLGGALLIAALAYGLFRLWVLAGLLGLASYHLLGWALELRRRRSQLAHQRALLDAVRYGAAVMSRAGNVLQMLTAVAGHGPWQTRRHFASIVATVQDSQGAISLADATRRVQDQLGDPMFDDMALALILHARRGSRLVPALEAIAADWEQTLTLQREAKAMRAGIEASVLILTILPFVFLVLLQLSAPALLAPFHSPLGEVVFGAAVAWMVLGYRVLQRFGAPPVEARIPLAREQAS